MVCTMSSQEHLWLLSEESVLLDLVEDITESEDGNEDVNGEVILKTYGRGKSLSAIVLPRMPNTCINVDIPPVQTHIVQTQEVVPGIQPSRGRGRARLIKNRLEKITNEKLNCRVPNGLKTFQKDSEKPSLPSRGPVEPFTLPAPPDYLSPHNNNYNDYQGKFSSERSSSSSLSLLDFPVLESPKKKKKQNKGNSDSANSHSNEKTNKLSLNSLTDSILASSKSDEASKSNEMNTDSCISDDILPSDELLVLDDDIDSALDEHLSSLDDMSNAETGGACGGMVTSVNTNVVHNNLNSSQKQEILCDNTDVVTDWTIAGENVIQCDGLPQKCDISVLEEIIASFGKIIDSQKIISGNSSSVRFKLSDSDSCEWVISCLHDSDCVYPDSSRVLECYRVDM